MSLEFKKGPGSIYLTLDIMPMASENDEVDLGMGELGEEKSALEEAANTQTRRSSQEVEGCLHGNRGREAEGKEG